MERNNLTELILAERERSLQQYEQFKKDNSMRYNSEGPSAIGMFSISEQIHDKLKHK